MASDTEEVSALRSYVILKPSGGSSEPADTPHSHIKSLPIPTVRQLRPFPRPPIAEFHTRKARTEFSIWFRVFEQTDLRVTIDGEELTQDAFSFDGNLVHFPGWDDADEIMDDPDFIEKHNGFPGYKGGTVTLDTAVENTIVRIWSDPAPTRTTDYVAGEIKMASLNRAAHLLWRGAVAQRLKLGHPPVLGFATTHVLTAAESGGIFKDGALTLPAASPGLHYDLIGGSAARAGSDTIRDATNSGTAIAASGSNAMLRLLCPKPSIWFVARKTGDWGLI